MNLATAVRIGPGSRIALTGAGGKTSALFALGREYLRSAHSYTTSHRNSGAALLPETALLAGATHLHHLQGKLADHHYIVRDQLPSLDDINRQQGLLLFSGPPGGNDRLMGLLPEQLEALLKLNQTFGFPLIIESDGARRLPLKAPARHEPVVPEWVDAVVVAAGLSGLFKPLDAERVFRPEIFSDLAGIKRGELIQPEHLARVLTHPLGGLKGIPGAARRVALLNQANTPGLCSSALRIADLLAWTYDAVIVADLPPAEQDPTAAHAGEVHAVHERIAGVVLAAGASSRYGSLKQLLDWQGEPLVRRAARAALAAGLSPVVVVAGNSAALVGQAVAGLPMDVVFNPDWADGQASSVKSGLRALPPEAGGVVFLLADQPYVSPMLIRGLVELHAASLAPVVAPLVEDRRSNPVLFDRATFPDFFGLSGDAGGRALFSRYSPLYLPWLDERLLLDIDTPQDYDRHSPGA